MTARVLLIHGGKSTVPKLEAAWPGARASVIYREGLSSGYNEVTGLAKQFPKFGGLLAAFVPELAPADPLIVLGYSAGGWALRHYLREEWARERLAAAVFLDASYGKALDPYAGTLAFAKRCNAGPQRLVFTWSRAHPEPGQNAQAIARAAGDGPGVWLRPYPNTDHGAQQGVAGPDAVRELAEHFRRAPSSPPGPGGGTDGLGIAAMLGGLLWWWKGKR